MTLIKKFAWYGSTVVASLVMAIALLVSSAGTAQAAAVTGITFGPAAPLLAGTAVGNGVLLATGTFPTAGAAGNKLVITFPTGTSFSGTPAATDWVVAGTTTAAFTEGVPVYSGNTVTIPLTEAITAAETITVTTGTTGTRLLPTTATAAASLTLASTTAADVAIDSGTIATGVLLGIRVVAAPTSVAGDGISTTTITITTVNAAGTATSATTSGDTLTVTTSAGTFTNSTVAISGAFNPVLATVNSPTATATLLNPTTAGANTLTLRTPATGAGSLVVSAYVTPSTGGNASLQAQSSVTLTAATANPVLTSISVTPTTAINVGASGVAANAAAIGITLLDQNGANLASGTTVRVSTNLGVVDSNATTCQLADGGDGPDAGSDVDCSFVYTGGTDTVNLFGTNLPGAATVTISATPIGSTTAITTTKTVTFVGTVATLAAKTQGVLAAGGAFVDTATPNATTFTNGFRLAVDPRDSTGNRVPGVTPTIVVSPAGCVNTGASVASTATTDARITLTAGTGTAGQVCTITASFVVGTATRTAVTTITIGGTTPATVTVTAPGVAPVSTSSITVGVKDSAGNAVGDGTVVTLVVTAGAVADNMVETVNGVATFVYVSPATNQTVNATAVAGTVTGSINFQVAPGAGPSPSGPGDFAAAPNFGSGNVGSAVFNGGSVEQLAAAVTAAGGVVVWVQDSNGQWRSYNTLATGAGAFVNNGFNNAFADGFAGATAVFVVR